MMKGNKVKLLYKLDYFYNEENNELSYTGDKGNYPVFVFKGISS